MKKSLSHLIALSLLPTASVVFANSDDALKLSSVVVSASRQPENASDVYNAVSVLTRADIDRLQPNNLADLLTTVPGMTITQGGGVGSISGYFLRGTASAQTLVLIDGVRSSGAASGTTAIETLSVDQIERIEVIRGARSTIYGADAIGGVIQIFTRKAEGTGFTPRIKLGYGSNNAWERSVGTSYVNNSTRLNINLSSEEITDHNRSTSPDAANLDDDAYRNNSLSLNASHNVNNQLEVGASYLQQEGETEYDFGWLGAYPYDQFKIKNLNLFANTKVNENWYSRIEFGLNENDNINLFDDAPDRSFFNTERESILWLNTLSVNSANTLQIGVDTYNDKLKGSTPFTEDSRRNSAAFVQHQFAHAKLSTEIGVRYDDNEAYGDNTSFNLGAALPLNNAVKLFATYNQAFRAPGFSDLYYPDYSNPNLKPEESENVELKLTVALSKNSDLEFAIYHNKLTEAIVYDENFVPQNASEAELEGAEATYRTQLLGWSIIASAAYVDAINKESGLKLNRRPQESANLELFRQWGDWGFSTSVRGASHSYNDALNNYRMGGYALWNARVSYNVTSSLKAALKLDNLLDKNYATALNGEGWPTVYRPYNELGRTVNFAITWTPSF